MNNTRIRGSLEKSCSGYTVFDLEHALTECIRSERPMFRAEKTADVFVADQSFFWTSTSMIRSSENDIICVQSNDSDIVCKERTSQRDMKAFESISVIETAPVYHRWWEPKPNRDDCVAHFAEECNNDGVLMATELLFPTLEQRAASGNKRRGELELSVKEM